MTRQAQVAAVLLTFAVLAIASFEATYRDASGADCVAFGIGDHEIDLCHGRFSR